MKQRPQFFSWPKKTKQIFSHLFFSSPIYHLILKGRKPDRLIASPPLSQLGNPENGQKILDGNFTLFYETLQLGEDPWATSLDNKKISAYLHGFSWLSDLYAVGNKDAQTRANQLVTKWLEKNGKWQELYWRPDILGERIASWLGYFEFITSEQPQTREKILCMIMVQARHLKNSYSDSPSDSRFFKTIQGLIFAATCIPEAGSMLDMSLKLLSKEIKKQILPDGGHIERNPSTALELLCRFNQLKIMLISAHIEIPIQLQGAIDRIPPLLRALRLGDGCLTQFNGSFEEKRYLIDRVLADTGVRGKALNSAPHSGFQRLATGRTIIVVDTGKPARSENYNTHAGTLSFEMSVEKERLIVNCGTASSEGNSWLSAMQATAAHSTLSVDDRSSSKFDAYGQLISAPQNVEYARREAEGSIWLETSHDGMSSNLGIIHYRKFFLDISGEDFRGEDIIQGSGGKIFTVRFHLHPNVDSSQVHGGSSILLRPGKGSGWQFQAVGGSINLEESVYLNGQSRPRRCEQIVISGPLTDNVTHIKWRFQKV